MDSEDLQDQVPAPTWDPTSAEITAPTTRLWRPDVVRKGAWTLGVSLLAALSLLGLAATAATLGARQVWWLELFTHLRLQLALFLAACAIGLLLLGARSWATLATLGAAFNLLVVGLLWLPIEDPSRLDAKPVEVLLANVRRENRDYEALISLVRQQAPDLVVLVEPDEAWLTGLAPLEADYPHRHAAPRDDDYGLALYSRWPLQSAATPTLGDWEMPALVARVTTAGLPLTVLTAHPPPPKSAAMAAERDRQLAQLAVLARGAPGPLILCADLNVTPWSPFFADLIRDTGLVDARRGRGIRPTWPLLLPPLARIPIDHCLVSPDLGVRDLRTGPGIGSDHLPLILNLAIPAG